MFVLCTVFGCRMSEARLSEWSEWDLESWVWTVPKDHSKTGVEIVRPVPEIIRQWVTDVHEETKHTGYVLGSLRIRESVSKIGGKSVNVWAMKNNGHYTTLEERYLLI